MEYIRNKTEFNIKENTAVSLGKFDGIHRGHDLLMQKVIAKKKENLASLAFTFDMPTRKLQDPKADDKVITTNSEKALVFERIGIDYLIECPLVDEVMKMEPEAFIKKLCDELHMKYVVVGPDFHFGYKRAGDYNTLIKYQKKYGYEVEVVHKLKDDGWDISSTRIRDALKKGLISDVNRLLGYDYFMEGVVIHGNQIGRKMSIPTVNIAIPENKELPPFGVYATITEISGKSYCGATNIGIKPTIPGENKVGAETNLFDFNGDIYDERIIVKFYKYIRPEKKFESIEELKSQIEKDVEAIKDVFKM
ncbi:MAG: bifunctional riboflavin kinase/FAD synthetase [Lachnospiraceae bacterium]|nr:bifunctional riboflavin kinase/FAD synthetase [Lachnospiraceae bacterium]